MVLRALRVAVTVGASLATSLGATSSAALPEVDLLKEVERLKAEVEKLKAERERPASPVSFTQNAAQPPAASPAARAPGMPRAPAAASDLRIVDAAPPGRGDPGTQIARDGCTEHPLYAALYGALQKLALLEQDPVEASYQIYEAWEKEPTILNICPVGFISAMVYLSIAQDQDWKYQLLHRATYFLYATPGLAVAMAKSKWPMSDRLIRTMYHNSEVVGRRPVRFTDPEVQPPAAPEADNDPGLNEAQTLSLQHRNGVKVHFTSVLFYHFYHQEKSPCACRTRSWCLPSWTRHLTNSTVDVWLAARDEQKTLFRMDANGCMRNLGIGLMTHHFVDTFDVLFVFEINALMHPQARIIPSKRVMLYPTFDLGEAQIFNFEELGASPLPDDAVIKPPNLGMRQLLVEALETRKKRSKKVKDRLLIFPADIRPMKGQIDFLQALVFDTAKRPSAVARLRGLTIVVAGGCDGNQTYCEEVMAATETLNNEGFVNVVVADQLKDVELAQLYAASVGVVLNSRVDCNPRAVYEGLWTDTPFFVTEQTRLSPQLHHLGHIHDGDIDRLPERLADFVDLSEAGGFEGRPLEFAKQHVTEVSAYRQILQWLDRMFLTGKQQDSIIKGEEALGAFGGALAGAGGLRGLF